MTVFEPITSQHFETTLSQNNVLSNHRQPKLAVCALEDFFDSLNIINEQVEMKTQIKKCKRVNKTLLTFYLLLLDVS